MASSAWRAARNAKALARLERTLPDIFPAAVMLHAHRRPFLPPSPRRCVESYWRNHPLRADRLARALANSAAAPPDWVWRLAAADATDLPASFRVPPAPYREAAFAKDAGYCRVCGCPVFRYGWHRDLWGDGRPNRNANWHACCVAAWKLWTAPSDYVRVLKARQGRRCPDPGERLRKDAEVDHRVPLFEVWRDRGSRSWPALLAHWGGPNLQVINRDSHQRKSIQESAERAAARRHPSAGPDLSA